MRSTGLTDPLTWTPEAQAGGEKRGAMGGWTTHRPPLGAKCSPQLGAKPGPKPGRNPGSGDLPREVSNRLRQKMNAYIRGKSFFVFQKRKNIGNSIILSLNHPDVLFLYKFSYLKGLNLYPFVRMTSFVKLSLTTIDLPEELLFFVQTEYGITSSRIYKRTIYENRR